MRDFFAPLETGSHKSGPLLTVFLRRVQTSGNKSPANPLNSRGFRNVRDICVIPSFNEKFAETINKVQNSERRAINFLTAPDPDEAMSASHQPVAVRASPDGVLAR
jgi:hypothetical protein